VDTWLRKNVDKTVLLGSISQQKVEHLENRDRGKVATGIAEKTLD